MGRRATTDPLTGLYNPRAFHDQFRQELRRTARYREPLSLLLMDLDGLKRVNDQFGPEAGDPGPRAVAWGTSRALRRSDPCRRRCAAVCAKSIWALESAATSLPSSRRRRVRRPPSF